jgi:hypothetical protein
MLDAGLVDTVEVAVMPMLLGWTKAIYTRPTGRRRQPDRRTPDSERL